MIGQTARAMTDAARQEATIPAPAAELWAVLTDFERYPSWARDLKAAEVVERDEQGRGILVRFRAAAMGRSTTYLLRYDYADAPHRLPWKLERGDIMRKLDGEYRLEAAGDSTHVVYELEVELVIPLPGFVKRRAEHKIMHTALDELRAHVERTPA
jgi:ribosome-associated toxin RatA of RatAB toxin-antitoxin module